MCEGRVIPGREHSKSITYMANYKINFVLKDSHTKPSISTDLKLSHQFLSFVFSLQKGTHTTKSIRRPLD